MKRIILLLTFCVAAAAQENPSVIEIRNLDVNGLGGFLRTFNVNYSPVPGTRFIALSGSTENVNVARRAIEKMDVPRKNLDLTFQIIVATTQPVPQKVPADLEPVIKQLKSAFVYQGYRVLDTMFVRNREGSNGMATGVIPGPENIPGMTFFQVEFRSTSITADPKATIVRIDHLKIYGRIPNGTDSKGATNFLNAGIETDVDVKEGQKVVVGKSNVDGKDGAIFMVVTAKVVD